MPLLSIATRFYACASCISLISLLLRFVSSLTVPVITVFNMGSWPIPVPCDGLVTGRPGPKFLIREPQGPAVNGQSVSKSVRELAQQVCHWRLAFEDAMRKNLVNLESTQKAKDEAQSRFIHHLCVSEGNHVPYDQSSASEAKETQEILRGLDFLEEKRSSGETCTSPEVVQSLHAELCCSSAKGAGQLRTCYAYSRKGNDIHWFPPPHVIPSSFTARLKKHNYYMSKKTTFADQHTPEYVDFVCRCAASLLYDFVELHPFKDGNDLVAHLLVSSVLQLVAPFQVIVPVDLSTLFESRNEHLKALGHERDTNKPAALAACLLEGLWHDWEWFSAQLNLDV